MCIAAGNGFVTTTSAADRAKSLEQSRQSNDSEYVFPIREWTRSIGDRTASCADQLWPGTLAFAGHGEIALLAFGPSQHTIDGSFMTTPDDWLADYDQKLQKLKNDTDRAQQELSQVGASASSPDGQITVRVNSSGVLEDIRFGNGFQHPKPDQVAASIMQTVREAQRQAAGQMVEVMQQFVGDGSALDFVKSSLPNGYAGDGTDEDAPAAGASRQPSQGTQPPQRRRPGADDFDDDDFSGGSFLR
jgi:DNA-binding protein YbaB